MTELKSPGYDDAFNVLCSWGRTSRSRVCVQGTAVVATVLLWLLRITELRCFNITSSVYFLALALNFYKVIVGFCPVFLSVDLFPMSPVFPCPCCVCFPVCALCDFFL